MTCRTRRGLAALLAAAACLLVPAGAPAAAPRILMSGSTSVYPLAVKLRDAYLRSEPGAARFVIRQGGSDIGINDVSKGKVTIGSSSRAPQASDPKGLAFYKIARDGVCIVTNPRNPLSNISARQVQDIFSGRVRSWRDVEGSQATGPINLVTRTQASGTQDAFQNIFLGPTLRVAGNASQKSTNGLVQQAVRSDPNAIGYVDFRFTVGTHSVPYGGVACNLANAASGQYAGTRFFYFVTKGLATGAAARFISWARSARGRRVVANGWVPIA